MQRVRASAADSVPFSRLIDVLETIISTQPSGTVRQSQCDARANRFAGTRGLFSQLHTSDVTTAFLLHQKGHRGLATRSKPGDGLNSPTSKLGGARKDDNPEHPYVHQEVGTGVSLPEASAAAKNFWTADNSNNTAPSSTPSSAAAAGNPLPKSSSNTVYYAFAGNTAILMLKGTMWLRSGSSAMMAETLHTFVDTLNQVRACVTHLLCIIVYPVICPLGAGAVDIGCAPVSDRARPCAPVRLRAGRILLGSCLCVGTLLVRRWSHDIPR